MPRCPRLLLYALLGSSRHMVVATMSATAALSASIVGAYAAAGSEEYVALTATLAIVTGVLAILAGLLRFGFLASFISEPVLKGFIVGLALTIIAGQLPKLFGVEKTEGNFFQQIAGLVRELGATNAATLVVGLVSLAIVLALRRWLPVVPGSLVAVLVGIAAVPLLDLVARGVAIVGPIEAGLPTVGLPQGRGVSDYLMLVASAAGVLLIAFAEGLAAAKAYADKAGYDIDPNQELIALGAANVGAGLTLRDGRERQPVQDRGQRVRRRSQPALRGHRRGPGRDHPAVPHRPVREPAGGHPRRGRHRRRHRARQRAVAHAPLPGLDRAASAGSTAGPRAPTSSPRSPRCSACWSSTSCPGLFIGIGVSLLLLIYRASRPQVATLVRTNPSDGDEGRWIDARTHPELASRDDVLVVRVESGLFFANADHVRQQIRDRITPSTVAVVIDAETTPAIDVSATDMLIALAAELRRRDIALLVAHGIGQIRDVLQHAGRDDDVLQTVYRTVDDAIASVDRSPHDRGPV